MLFMVLNVTNQEVVQAFAHAKWLVGQFTGIWFISWAMRRRAHANIVLTTLEQGVRWGVVLLCLAFQLLQGRQFLFVRLISLLLGLYFLVWPNVSHHLVRFVFRKPEKTDSSEGDQPS